MSEMLSNGIPFEPNPVEAAQLLLRKQALANKLLEEFNEKPEVATSRFGYPAQVFHEVYVIGTVEPYCPTDRDGRHMGWVISPVNPTLYEDENTTLSQIEAFGFSEVDHIIPSEGDIAHVRREDSWTGIRLSIEIIKDNPTDDEKKSVVDEADNIIKNK